MPAGSKATEQSIRDATRNSLKKTDELRCEHLVMPAIGGGVAGFDFNDGVHIICGELAAYEPDTLADVRLIAYADDEYDAMARIADDEYDAMARIAEEYR